MTRQLALLVRTYRPTVGWFLAVIGFFVVGLDLLVASLSTEPTSPAFSMFIAIVAVKYLLGTLGVRTVLVDLRRFVSAGVTRRSYLASVAAFGVLTAVGLAALVVLAHAAEAALYATTPGFSTGIALRELGMMLAGNLAYFFTGAAAAVGFYRYGGWRGAVLLVPAILPLGAFEALLVLADEGTVGTRLMPYAAALTASLIVTALGALLHQWQTRTVPIR